MGFPTGTQANHRVPVFNRRSLHARRIERDPGRLSFVWQKVAPMMRNLGLATALALATTAVSARAEAQETEPFAWDEEWPRFRTWEYVVSPLLSLPILVRLFPHHEARWHGGILLDDWFRDHAAVEPGPVRDLALYGGDLMIWS